MKSGRISVRWNSVRTRNMELPEISFDLSLSYPEPINDYRELLVRYKKGTSSAILHSNIFLNPSEVKEWEPTLCCDTNKKKYLEISTYLEYTSLLIRKIEDVGLDPKPKFVAYLANTANNYYRVVEIFD